MVPHSWVIESLNMIGIAKNVNFSGKTMKLGRVELTCGAETLEEVPIKRPINFSRGCTITVAVCNCHHISDTH